MRDLREKGNARMICEWFFPSVHVVNRSLRVNMCIHLIKWPVIQSALE